MPKIVFSFKEEETIIQINPEDQIKEICKQFANTIQKDINNIYFISNGNNINEELKYKEYINENNNKIFVYENIIKSNEIICPECKELAFININDYKINYLIVKIIII